MGFLDRFRGQPAPPEAKAESQEPAVAEIVEAAVVEPVEKNEVDAGYGFEVGETVLLRDSIDPNDTFKTVRAEVVGAGKEPERIKIKHIHSSAPKGPMGARPSLIYDVHKNDLVKLSQDEKKLIAATDLRELQLFKKYLADLEKLEARKREVGRRKFLDEPFINKWAEVARLRVEEETLRQQAEPDIGSLKRLEEKLHYLMGDINDMLDNIEEDYPSDDKIRIQLRSRGRFGSG